MTLEQTVSQDLDTGGYHFKWKAAKEYAHRHPQRFGEPESFEWWMEVRKFFLEIGGRYVGQR